MVRISATRALCIVGVTGLAGLGPGCGVGESDGTTPGPGPGEDASPQSLLCMATVALSGTFTASAALDPAGGCQPQGTWQVNVTVSDRGTCANVRVKTSYSYTLTGVGRATQIMYTKGTGEEFQGNVSATGDGQCSGFFEHILPDGSNFDQISLRPSLPEPTEAVTTLAIGGTGEFQLWKIHP